MQQIRERGGRQPNPTNNITVLGVKMHMLENDKRSMEEEVRGEKNNKSENKI